MIFDQLPHDLMFDGEQQVSQPLLAAGMDDALIVSELSAAWQPYPGLAGEFALPALAAYLPDLDTATTSFSSRSSSCTPVVPNEEHCGDGEEEDDSHRHAVPGKHAGPVKRAKRSADSCGARPNVNEIYSLKKYSNQLMLRLENKLGDDLLLDRHAWKRFLEQSGLSAHEQDCAKALRRKHSSRTYAGRTRKRKNEKHARTSSTNAQLLQRNAALFADNASLQRSLLQLQATVDQLQCELRLKKGLR